jgi:hypothetical protein
VIGDQSDIVGRLRAVLPVRWFPDSAPVLDALLSGLASGWSSVFQQLQYVRAQTRIATATDIWLDVVAQDYLGSRLVRRTGQADAAFRGAIQRELFRERGTRAAIVSVLQDLTGRPPQIFEPARPGDTGGYGSSAAMAGGSDMVAPAAGEAWPCRSSASSLPIVQSVGIAMISGWSSNGGAYGQGAIEYASLTMVQAQVTDGDIYNAVAGVLPVATIGWTRITD